MHSDALRLAKSDGMFTEPLMLHGDLLQSFSPLQSFSQLAHKVDYP